MYWWVCAKIWRDAGHRQIRRMGGAKNVYYYLRVFPRRFGFFLTEYKACALPLLQPTGQFLTLSLSLSLSLYIYIYIYRCAWFSLIHRVGVLKIAQCLSCPHSSILYTAHRHPPWTQWRGISLKNQHKTKYIVLCKHSKRTFIWS
jgi:hypothetical protein